MVTATIQSIGFGTGDLVINPLNSISISFSDLVTGFNLSEVRLFRNGRSVSLAGAALVDTTEAGDTSSSFSLRNINPATFAPGAYELRILKGNILGPSNTPLASVESESWNKQVEARQLILTFPEFYTGLDIDGNSSDETITGSNVADYLAGGDGNDTVRGLDGSDDLYGDEGNDTLFGGNGADYMEGEEGNDILFGGQGRDILAGGDGNDILVGGAGADEFAFDLDSNSTGDIVRDFVIGQDKLNVRFVVNGQQDFIENLRVVRDTNNRANALITYDINGAGTTGGVQTIAILQGLGNQVRALRNASNFVIEGSESYSY